MNIVYSHLVEYTQYIVTEDDEGKRLDRVIRRLLPDLPLSGIYRLIRKGVVRVEGKKAGQSCALIRGMKISVPVSCIDTSTSITVPKSRTEGWESMILLETKDLLFINKPAGIPVHGDNGLDRMIPVSSASKASLSFHSGPLHRLDQGTTGCIAFSRTLEGARWFSSGIKDKRIGKMYIAILDGLLITKDRWIDHDEEGKQMISQVIPLATSDKGKTLALFFIETGRKHQIRKQAAHHGYPLEGDIRYGQRSSCGRYYLHAWSLRFPDDRPMDLPSILEAPIPHEFTQRVADLFTKEVLAHFDFPAIYWSEHEKLK